jgi:hypothetical protein
MNPVIDNIFPEPFEKYNVINGLHNFVIPLFVLIHIRRIPLKL